MAARVSISNLPLPPTSLLLTKNLTADPLTADFTEVLKSYPSVQRRARLLSPESHFSYVSPFPISFPYHIEPPNPNDPPPEDKSSYIERWLADREAVHEKPSDDRPLKLYYPKNREEPRNLIGLSKTGLEDCVPNLDVGDAFKLLRAPSLSLKKDSEGEGVSGSEQEVSARTELIDVLSGHAMLRSDDFLPWSLRYSGHQFGTWAGQLGDGRAISVCVTPNPTSPTGVYELQLKGAGRTPFSRSADGLAVVRSSIREFLCAEAMHALGIPTTRSLTLISLPTLPVERERTEAACILTRLAPSFLRIGSFEALSPPTAFSFFGGGQQDADYEALRVLGEWVARKVLMLDVEEGKPWGEELVLECARRNARMVAAWQVYGFMHGVINTDNVSIMGLTIDYGPYAFMDVFDRLHICNHTDDGGRYAYRAQPSMIIYALRALLHSLAPLIGAERELGRAVEPGWASPPSEGDKETDNEARIGEWRKRGLEAVLDVMQGVAQEEMSREYGRLMRRRLGIINDPSKTSDFEARLSRPLLDLMENDRVDFHSTFRTLCSYSPSTSTLASELIPKILSTSTSPSPDAEKNWETWFGTYREFIEKDGTEEEERVKIMRSANPRFVLRQWLLEEVIKRVEQDEETGKRVLGKILEMCTNPFEQWGAEDQEQELEDEEVREERRFCGMGERGMLGFQCSCSS